MDTLSVLAFGYFGGFAVNILRLVELVSKPRQDRPETFKDPLYAFQFFAVPLLGAGLAFTYSASNTPLTPILALNIGASAPLVLKSFASTIPTTTESRTN